MANRADKRRKKKDLKKAAKLDRYRDQAGVAKRVKVVDGSLDDDNSTIMWSFALLDEHFVAGKTSRESSCFCEVTGFMRDFEKRTWEEVSRDSKQNHEIELAKICDEARRRLDEMKLDDIDTLWSFHFKGLWRLWGIRDRRVFQVLWWDPLHSVYPTSQQNKEKKGAG